TLMGAGRIARVTGSTLWYSGALRELSMGNLSAADLNGNGTNTDAFPVDEVNGHPVLGFVFDNSGHGTHVAGIAAAHNLFGVPGFDGVAPGAQLIGLKIANNA